MVLRHEGADAGGKVVARRQLQAGADVLGDHLRAGQRVEPVVGVMAVHLVLDVEAGLDDLADVVEVRADADQQRVGAGEVGGALGQVADDDAVVERAGRLLLQLAKERMAELGQLHELDAGGDAEGRAQDVRAAHDDDDRAQPATPEATTIQRTSTPARSGSSSQKPKSVTNVTKPTLTPAVA